METEESIRLRRAVTLFDNIAAEKSKEDAIKRQQLAEHIRKQKELLDRRENILEKRRTETELAVERDRKRFLIERRKKQFAVAGGRVPTPLEQLHPGSPHYRKSTFADTKPNQPSGGADPSSAAAVAVAPLSSTTAQPYESNISLHLLSKPSPAHIGSLLSTSNTLPEPALLEVTPEAPAAPRPVFKSNAYRREARELRELRTPHTPSLSAPPLSEIRAPLPELKNVRPRVDSRRRGGRRKAGMMISGRRKSAKHGRPESGGADHELDSAIEEVFQTEEAYRKFKQKYEKPVDVGMPVETEMHEAVLMKRQVPERLATKRTMYTTATRNRQRTVTFARSGGASGGGTAITAIPPFPSTPLHAPSTAGNNTQQTLPNTAAAGGIEPGLEAFGPHFAHVVTDAPKPVPDIDATDQAAAEAAYALALEAELAAIKRPKSGNSGKGGAQPPAASSSLWSSRPGTRSRLSNAYESLMNSRPPSVLANPLTGNRRMSAASPNTGADGSSARQVSISTRQGGADNNAAVMDSAPLSRRGSLTRQEVLDLATEQMGKGRRGPSAKGERSRPSTTTPAGDNGVGGGGNAAGERSMVSSAKRGSVFVPSSAGAEGKPRESVLERGVPPIFSTAVPEEEEDEKPGVEDDVAVLPRATSEQRAGLSLMPRPPSEQGGFSFANMPLSDVPYNAQDSRGGTPDARQADSTGLAYGIRKAPRVVRSWQPISMSAASECKRTILPTALFKLPSLSCRDAAAAAAEEIRMPALAARFWNPPI
ncbi:hypothetical protein HDU86_000679 [Geranomyces michiganensis]|nr:hypothetical protein HDU86_000679 [Geranomyces michiganensis]